MKNVAGLFGIAFLAFTPLAHANFAITYSVNGAAPSTCINNPDSTNDTGTTECFSSLTAIGGGVSAQDMSGTSNSPGTSGVTSFQTSSDTTIIATTAATLDIWISAQNFVNPHTPPGPVEYTSSLTLIPTASASTSVSLVNCVDENNALPPGLGGTFCGAPAPGGTLNNALVGSGSTSVSNNNNGAITTLTAPFSLEEHITVTLAAGSHLEIQTSQDLTQVPEPVSAVLFGTLLVGVGIFRRRQLKQI
jgi:hypothetical protein